MLVSKSELVRSDHGRKYGWAVFRDGIFVGRLVDPVWEDMFWHSYKVVARRERVHDPRFDISDKSFWRNIEGLTYVNLVMGLSAPNAFPAGDPPRNGRVWMRGLYVCCERGSFLARLVNWFGDRR